MNPLFALVAPLALLVPTLGAMPVGDEPADLLPRAEPVAASPVDALDPAEVPSAWQVRIEQRVTIRIAPLAATTRPAMLAEMAPPAAPRLSERKMGKCVAVAGIAAVQPDAGGRLLLYMRDQRLISASLEKACSARDFYSGFYLERSKDGMLCVDRDKLRSRAGASCQLGKMRQLVATND